LSNSKPEQTQIIYQPGKERKKLFIHFFFLGLFVGFFFFLLFNRLEVHGST